MGTSLYDLIDAMLMPEGVTLTKVPMTISIERVDNPMLPEIKDVIFNDPATIVFWEDGTKTIVKCRKELGDTYSKETGLAMAIAKKAYGNKGNFNDVFNRWLGNGDNH